MSLTVALGMTIVAYSGGICPVFLKKKPDILISYSGYHTLPLRRVRLMFILIVIYSYLMFYYTNCAGINAAAIGVMMVVTRFVDAFTDYMVGVFIDRTDTKYGRYRPWMLAGAPVLAVGMALLVSQQFMQTSRFAQWFHRDYGSLNIAATYNLVFNASLMVEAGLGCALTYEGLVNTAGRELCFRPIVPRLEDELYFVWKKFQVFSRASERFLTAVRQDCEVE